MGCFFSWAPKLSLNSLGWSLCDPLEDAARCKRQNPTRDSPAPQNIEATACPSSGIPAKRTCQRVILPSGDCASINPAVCGVRALPAQRCCLCPGCHCRAPACADQGWHWQAPESTGEKHSHKPSIFVLGFSYPQSVLAGPFSNFFPSP